MNIQSGVHKNELMPYSLKKISKKIDSEHSEDE